MRNRLFTAVLILFFLTGVGIFVLPQREVSVMEKRNLANNHDITLSSLMEGRFSNVCEDILKDQFYQRDSLTKTYYQIKILFNAPFASSSGSDGSLDGVSFRFLSDDVIEINDGYLINNILLYDEAKAYMAASRGYNIDEMDRTYPDVKTYIYFPTRLEEILDVGNDLNYGLRYRETFIRQFNENITWSALQISSVEDHQNFFFKSDHHWNIKGAYQGYTDIVTMIGKDYDIGGPKKVKDEITYDYEFHGNISSQIGMIGESDHISDYTLEDIGEYTLLANGEPLDLSDVKRDYAQNGNTTQYSDYDLYFGDNYFIRVFDFHQEDRPNILIFGDSFTNAIQEWLASHFNKTVLIDLRGKDDSFSLASYLKEYDIDIILVTLPYNDMFFNGNMYVPLP